MSQSGKKVSTVPPIVHHHLGKGADYPGLQEHDWLEFIPENYNRKIQNGCWPTTMKFPAGALHYAPPILTKEAMENAGVEKFRGPGYFSIGNQLDNHHRELRPAFPNIDGVRVRAQARPLTPVEDEQETEDEVGGGPSTSQGKSKGKGKAKSKSKGKSQVELDELSASSDESDLDLPSETTNFLSGSSNPSFRSSLGSDYNGFLSELGALASAKNPHIRVYPRAVHGKTSQALDKKWPKEAGKGSGAVGGPKQTLSPVSSACASGANGTPVGQCSLLWLLTYDNSVTLTASGILRDLDNELADFKEDKRRLKEERSMLMEERSGLKNEREKAKLALKLKELDEQIHKFRIEIHRLKEQRRKKKQEWHEGRYTGHSLLLIFVCRNVYIFDPTFPNIKNIGYSNVKDIKPGKNAYTLRQFRTMRTAEQALHVLKQKHQVCNVFIGGGGNHDEDTCEQDVEDMIRNVVEDLMDKPANQTEEDVIGSIWSSAKYFWSKQVWPVELETSVQTS